MFGLSTMELLIIVVLALIFIGPDQLPKVARTLGKGLRQFRGAMDRVDGEVRRVVREASAEFDEFGRPIRETVEDAMRQGADEADAAAKPDHSNDDADLHSAFKPKADEGAAPTKPAPSQVSDDESAQAFASAASRFADRDWSQVGKRPVPGQVVRAPATPSVAAKPEASSPHEAAANTAPSAEPSVSEASSQVAHPHTPEPALPIGHVSDATLLGEAPAKPVPEEGKA